MFDRSCPPVSTYDVSLSQRPLNIQHSQFRINNLKWQKTKNSASKLEHPKRAICWIKCKVIGLIHFQQLNYPSKTQVYLFYQKIAIHRAKCSANLRIDVRETRILEVYENIFDLSPIHFHLNGPWNKKISEAWWPDFKAYNFDRLFFNFVSGIQF